MTRIASRHLKPEAAPRPGDMRTLGYSDGMAWALVWVKQEIRQIEDFKPNPAHRHKWAEYEKRLVPLNNLRRRIEASYKEATDAFDQATKQPAT